MQQLMLSAAAFPFTLAPDDTEGIQGQFALLVSVLDASGNQVEQLGQDSFHCFIHFAELDGLFAPPISQFEEFGRGLYRLIALGEGREGREPTAPLQVAIIVEQVDVKQEGPRQVQLEVIARGPGVVSAVHGKDYLP